MIKSLKSFTYLLVSVALLIGLQSEAFAAKKSKTLNNTIKNKFFKVFNIFRYPFFVVCILIDQNSYLNLIKFY